jgi:predicted nucleotidyltransferase
MQQQSLISRDQCRELPATLCPEDKTAVLEAARFLRQQGAARVWLFGSLARGRRPTVHSDFDFAVEGLPGERFLGCLGRLLQVLPRSVDLVELESCPAFLRWRILDEGILLTA